MSSEPGQNDQSNAMAASHDLAAKIRTANETLLDATISLYLAENYDVKLLPKKSEHLREWWESDSKTRMHARFCLPLTMASGLGYYILSPATFTVTWNGAESDYASVEVQERSSHADIRTDVLPGTFSISSSFVARTKSIGDYVYVKSIANYRNKPYSIMDAMLEAWWDPSEISIIGLLNRPGKFTIKKGEPLAQMFVLNHEQTDYALEGVSGRAPLYDEWLVRQEMPEKNLDYFRGRLPNQTPVCPHFRDWSNAQLTSNTVEQLTLEDVLQAVDEAQEQDNPQEALRQLEVAVRIALTKNVVTEPILASIRTHVHAIDDAETRTRLLVSCYKLGEALAATGQKLLFAEILTDIGNEYKLVEHFTRAEDYLKRSLMLKKEAAADPLSIARTGFELGAIYDYKQNFAEAEKLLSESLATYTELCETDNEELVFVKNLLANVFSHQKKFEQAESLYEEVLAQRIRMHGSNAMQLVPPLKDYVAHFRERGDLDRANEYQSMLISVLSQSDEESTKLEIADAHEIQYWLNRDNNNPAAARIELTYALNIRQELLDRNDESLRRTNQLLGDVCTELGDDELAAQYYADAN